MGVAAASCCLRRDVESGGTALFAKSRRSGSAPRDGRVTDHYQLGQRIGKGSYGEVKKATRKCEGSTVGQRTVAVKVIHTSSRQTEQGVMEEVDLMRSLQHPNIVRVYNVYKDVLTMYVVMELCVGGDVFEWFAKPNQERTERHAATIMEQIMRGVCYLHQQSICHRDLKPENFLLLQDGPIDDNLVKICDFGISCRCSPGQKLTKRVFSGYYVAPEVLQGKYGNECDVWSCGVSLYILLCGHPPFAGRTEHEMLSKIISGSYVLKDSDWAVVSSEAKELVKSMLQKDVAKRCTAEQVLMHSWFKDRSRQADHVLTKDLADRLRSFQRQNKLKKVALRLMAHHAEDEHIREMRKTFVALDVNGDGMLSLEEVRQGILNGGADLPDDLKELLETLTADGSESIPYDAFLAAMMDRHTHHAGIIKQVFDSIDTNSSGSICIAEIREAIQSTWSSEGGKQLEVTQAELDEVIQEIDVNGDGEIDLEEFTYMMKQSTPKHYRD